VLKHPQDRRRCCAVLSRVVAASDEEGNGQSTLVTERRVMHIRQKPLEGRTRVGKGRMKEINGLVFAVGTVLGLLGYVADVYSSTVATILMLGVWIVGGALVSLVLAEKE